METEVCRVSDTDLPPAIARAAALLRAGSVVAFPTETVYGLGADALAPAAVQKIFIAKERPADNPLIVHVADPAAVYDLVETVTPAAKRLIEAFWPGPLSIVLRKRSIVPTITTAGLDTVVLRCPDHPTAHALITATGRPIAAPSANRSGRVSPTIAAHVAADLGGRIPLILDGGAATQGIESTVVDAQNDVVTLLRSGSVTQSMLEAVVPVATVQPGSQRVTAPGMKYRHYAPAAKLTLVRPPTALRPVLAEPTYASTKTAVLTHSVAPGSFRRQFTLPTDPAEAAPLLYATLRATDAPAVQQIVVEGWEPVGVAEALMDRLGKAAAVVR